MINKKTDNKGIALITLILIFLIIVIILILAIFAIKVLSPDKNSIKEDEIIAYGGKENKDDISNNNSNINTTNTNTSSSDNSSSTIKLNIGNKEKITGGELLTINDYKISIPSQLVQIGYDIALENNALRIKSKDNSYECVLVQLSDNYVMPTEEEINAFYDTPECKKLDSEDYNFDDGSFELHLEKEEQLFTSYFKSLGYNAQNSPDYVLTSKELNSIIGKYDLDGEVLSSGRNGLFPGYEDYKYYKGGKTTRYTIPKYYKDSTFGERTSKFSICLYLFEYYDSSKVKFNVSLWRF